MEKLWKEIPDTDGKYLISTSTIPFQEFAKESQKPLAVIGGDI